MRYLFLLSILLRGSISFSTVIPVHLISHADSIAKSLTIKHKELAAYLAAPCESDREKVLIFSYWISKNIQYDLAENKRLGRNKIPREVLDNRRAVCKGYSLLFEQLCEDVSIRAFSIDGYGYGNILKRILNNVHCRHAWNVVYVDQKWELLDITWSTKEIKTKEFKENHNLKWIFVEPILFSETHYPNDPKWQLLDAPKTKKEFWRKQTDGDWKPCDQQTLALRKDASKIDSRLDEIKSQFQFDQNKHDYLDNLIRLSWSCSNGAFDSTRIVKGIELFNFTKQEVISTSPRTGKRNYLNMIRSGILISQKRLEQKA